MLEHWTLLEADFQEHYHLDLLEHTERRSKRWLEVRVAGLFAIDSRLNQALHPQPQKGGSPWA